MNSIKNLVLRPSYFGSISCLTKRYVSGGLYEPDYLEGLKPKVPLYDTLNIHIKGYDYPVLESYQKFLHNILKNIDINVEECWALPAQVMNISTYKPRSEIVNAQYNLKLYNRFIQITDVAATQLPIVIRTIEATLPAGVSLNVRPHEEADEEIRYIPDSELNSLKQQLDDLGGPAKTKK
ncbi:hypothetical protein NQ315_003902 [Exocentrus adspersus]|uniref:Small ribosomal subunit protein uS10 domain-containing protein n=1 Tax=Exocentrus adspersus TaxID=1586481 RepID=A0AAV8VYC7_9CUCU|nr:hypothetical protein NQ315_003902 [Exocentrus adspersus]